jgi:putative oxidoreductase
MIDTRTAPYAALLLRLTLGAMFVSHGLIKLFVFTPAGTVAFFGSLGIPAAFAYLTMAGELGGGILLILGVWPRVIAVLQLPILIGALFVHSGNGLTFSNQGGGWEYPAFLVAAQVILILLGDGALALLRSGEGPQALFDREKVTA